MKLPLCGGRCRARPAHGRAAPPAPKTGERNRNTHANKEAPFTAPAARGDTSRANARRRTQDLARPSPAIHRTEPDGGI
ncbi:hypothetical protein CF642_38175, partial [Burkholderia pseudomallei]